MMSLSPTTLAPRTTEIFLNYSFVATDLSTPSIVRPLPMLVGCGAFVPTGVMGLTTSLVGLVMCGVAFEPIFFIACDGVFSFIHFSDGRPHMVGVVGVGVPPPRTFSIIGGCIFSCIVRSIIVLPPNKISYPLVVRVLVNPEEKQINNYM